MREHTFNPTLPDRWTISPRLMACWTFEDGSTLECDRDGHYIVTDTDGTVLDDGTDYSPSILARTWADILEGIVGFLGHAGETYRAHMGGFPNDGCVFNAETDAWAYMHDDELGMLSLELEGC